MKFSGKSVDSPKTSDPVGFALLPLLPLLPLDLLLEHAARPSASTAAPTITAVPLWTLTGK
jgi:hypothetical protein